MCSAATAEKLTIERMFAAPDLAGASLRSPHISPDGRFVAYLRGKDNNKDRLDLWAYDIARHEHRLLVDSALLEPHAHALSAEEEARRERQRTSSLSGIVEYEFSSDSRHLLVPVGGDLYVYDLQAKPEKAVRRLTSGGRYETDAHFSPHGAYVSFVRDQNLVVYDLASSTERPITKDGGGVISYGTAEFIAQEEMSRTTGYWWSPDEKRIVFTRVDAAPVAEVDRFEIYADSVKVIKQRYPAAGAHNAIVQLLVQKLDAAAGSAPVQIDLGTNTDIYLARVNWLPHSDSLAVQRQSRDQKTLTLLKADATSGKTTELLSEHSDTWVDLHDELTFLNHSPRFIWASSRSGCKHLYLYDLDGKLIRPLTGGEWQVTADSEATRAIAGVDEKRGIVYFMANIESPLERHLYSISLDDAHTATPQRITADVGWHAVTMSKDARVFLDTFSTPDRPPSLTLRSAEGKTLAALVPNELTPDHPYAPYLSEHLPTEFGTLQANDGETLYYQIIRPRNPAPGKRYPVVVDVYGGPGVQKVQRSWGGSAGLFRQYLAQHGYIVFTLDNRGSAGRGVKFKTALYHHMGSVEVQDQVAGANFLKTLPYVDPRRIAVFGWSYGGYMTLMCMMQAPDVFAAGVAGAPVTDWHLYDTHYTEQFMGTPQENAAGYTGSSVLTYADQLRGPLLIMHGMADDNVLFTHSTTLFKKLQDLDKQFDVMTYPGSKHGLLRFAATGPHGYATIKRFLDTQLGVDAGH
jgi:dipeptidyl-peptidase-4